MKNLFEPSSVTEIKKRIERLGPDSERQWGAMTSAQMLAHCAAWMEMAAGLKNPPRSFMGRIFGKMAKKSVLGEGRLLLDSLDFFLAGGPELCTSHPHCFFGYMTPMEWAIMGYKHLDHHLRQFGA